MPSISCKKYLELQNIWSIQRCICKDTTCTYEVSSVTTCTMRLKDDVIVMVAMTAIHGFQFSLSSGNLCSLDISIDKYLEKISKNL